MPPLIWEGIVLMATHDGLWNYPQFLGLKDIGTITNTSSLYLANLRRSHMDFPIPITEIGTYPIYDTNSVVNWLTLNSIEFDLSLLKTQTRKDIEKQINIIGLDKAGKTKFASKLCSHEYILRESFDNISSEANALVHKYIIRRHCPEMMCCMRFVSPKSSLHGLRVPLEMSAIEGFYEKIKNDYHNIAEAGGGHSRLNPNEDMIEIYTSASPLTIAILENDDDGIIVYDFPSISSGFWPNHVSNSSTYLLMLNDNIRMVSGKNIASQIPYLAGAKIVFACRINDLANDAKSYKLLAKRAESMKEMYVKSIKSHLDEAHTANKTSGFLCPSSVIVPMGFFQSIGTSYSEQKFYGEISKSLKQSLSHYDLLEEESIISEILSKRNNDQSAITEIKDYLYHICSKVVGKITVYRQGQYDIQSYLNEGHFGTELKNEHATICNLRKSMAQLQKKIYNVFCFISPKDCLPYFTHKEQELLIGYCYKKIVHALNTDCGAAHGYHDYDSSPPIALWVHESVVAGELAKIHPFNLNAPESVSLSQAYIGHMGSLFHSHTWGYVKIRPPYTGRLSYCNKKIEVLSRCKLYSLCTENMNEYISNCYNVGLLMLGMFSVFNHFTETYSLSDDGIEAIGKLSDSIRNET